MKKKVLKYLLFTSLVIVAAWFSVNKANAQSDTSEKELIERMHVVTDREIYCVGEDLLFSAYNLSSADLRDIKWSNILYIEIITPDGESVLQKKYSYGPDGVHGVIVIPDWILTGNYYLRAYTRWMRDFSPYNYFYKVIKIVNPFRSVLLEPTVDQEVKEGESFETPKETNLIDIRIPSNEPVFGKREQIVVEVRTKKPQKFHEKLAVSVVRKGAANNSVPKITRTSGVSYTPKFIPETRGLSVSGKAVNANDSIPLPYTLVALTVFKEKPENLNVITDEKGRFFFDLSFLKGEYELFISAKADKDSNFPLILVDNDFSSAKIQLPYIPVDLSNESRELYQTLNFTSQIQALYHEEERGEMEGLNQPKPFLSDTAFYGQPDFSLILDDYVQLPSLSEYFYELVPSVKGRQQGGKSSLKVMGANPEMSIYDPLILVDMVSVFDVDKVLSLPPERIQRIEVILSPFIRGDVTYGGVVSFFSRKGDLAGIDLPATGRFINYNMLSEGSRNIADKKLTDEHVPDLRNCLYWNPSVQLDETGSTSIRFNTGDNTGEYIIVVHAVDQSGAINLATKEIRID
ncbi:hypothetical protein [Sunxiuqinia indica]|uniref:hypothetical protein n=1 Tax=Sunxiuqinia indica TaxID=2692584 RepID=UPI001357D5F1|nr:hypothetical protein [Sunxiuqinia indica]